MYWLVNPKQKKLSLYQLALFSAWFWLSWVACVFIKGSINSSVQLWFTGQQLGTYSRKRAPPSPSVGVSSDWQPPFPYTELWFVKSRSPGFPELSWTDNPNFSEVQWRQCPSASPQPSSGYCHTVGVLRSQPPTQEHPRHWLEKCHSDGDARCSWALGLMQEHWKGPKTSTTEEHYFSGRELESQRFLACCSPASSMGGTWHKIL
jgi:hypothetical protein